MSAGTQSPDQVLADMGAGLLIMDMFGPSLNKNNGDYSVGVSGFAIENGERAYPVNEITVAGNLKDMFQHMTPANDLEFDGPSAAPSIMVEGMTIAGT
jgi:PmbA protein